MDGRSNRAGNGATAVVAREFQPTRIEHALLAQAFDLICRRSTASNEALLNASMTSQEATRTGSEQRVHAGVAGRRAA
jgi:hypothetical protein